MQLTIHKGSKRLVGELDKNILLEDLQDIIDLLGNAGYLQTEGIIIRKVNLPNSFFELRNGLAGEVLQKFSNYSQRLAIIGDFSTIESKSLRDFIRESNRNGLINFVEDFNNAMLVLNK